MGILEVHEAMVDFANAKPALGFEVNYLERAVKVLNMYSEALVISEENPENEKRLLEIENKISSYQED